MATKNTDDAVDYVAESDADNTDDAGALVMLKGAGTGIRDEIRELITGAPSLYSSIKGDDFAARRAVAEKLTNSVPISENLGVKIDLKDVIIQPVQMQNVVTGAYEDQPRVILIDTKGTAYHAISKGLFLAVRNIIGVVGEPHTWPEALPVVVKREKAAMGHFFTLEFA